MSKDNVEYISKFFDILGMLALFFTIPTIMNEEYFSAVISSVIMIGCFMGSEMVRVTFNFVGFHPSREISSSRDYVEDIALQRAYTYIQLDRFYFAKVKYTPFVFQELYLIINNMQKEKVHVFITNDPEGREITFKEMKDTLSVSLKQTEHVLAIEEMLFTYSKFKRKVRKII